MSSRSLTSSPTRVIGCTAVRRRAGGVLGLVVVLHAAQMIGQRLAAGTTRRALGLAGVLGKRQRLAARRVAPRRLGFVLQQRVLEHLALLGVIASLLAPNFQRFSRASSK
jgi:hypothetical protein